MQRLQKRVSESRTEQIQILMPQHINGAKRLFGGVLMQWIDVVAGVAARRHANAEVTTASVDNLQFKSPAYVNSTLILIGTVTFVGRTSMEVRVDTFVEELDGQRKLINRAYVVMVALDEQDRPMEVPGLVLETDEERQEFEAGRRRNALRKQRRAENF